VDPSIRMRISRSQSNRGQCIRPVSSLSHCFNLDRLEVMMQPALVSFRSSFLGPQCSVGLSKGLGLRWVVDGRLID